MQPLEKRRPIGRLRSLFAFGHLRPDLPALVGLAAGVVLAGCGGRMYPAPEDALDEPREVLEATLERLFPIEDGRIRAWLEVFGGRGRARVRQAVLYSFPDRVRVETISPFDTSMNVLVLADGSLDYYDLQEQLYYRGPATPENVSGLAPIPLTPEDMVRVLAGGPPLDRVVTDPDRYSMAWNRRVGAYTVSLPLLDGGVLELDVRHGDWALAGAREFDGTGQVRYEVRCGDFRMVGASNTMMPHRIRVRVPDERVELELEVERYDLNPGLPPAMFELEPPRGVDVIPL